MTTPVTFGFVNCNRLHYLRSCVESFLECTYDYENKQVIIVDNASVEYGTEEYLIEKENQGILVIRNEQRNPAGEFALAKNQIVENATGDFIAPLAADMQFTSRGEWLKAYVNFLEANRPRIGQLPFDAQRKIRNDSARWGLRLGSESFKFIEEPSRSPLMGAGNCLFDRNVIMQMYPWETSNDSHVGLHSSETKMLKKTANLTTNMTAVSPVIPVSAGIYNPEGGNARVRGNLLLGEYIAPRDSYKYYNISESETLRMAYGNRETPVGIEEIALPLGWKAPIDDNNNWIKHGGPEDDQARHLSDLAKP